MGKINRKFFGLSQYKAPFSYELAGKHFHILMDDGRDFSLRFLDGKTLQWAENGKPYVQDGYQCLKGDDTTFLVHTRPACGNGQFCMNWVLDLEQRLVTLDFLEQRYEEGFDRLVRNTPFFGAIDVPGFPLPTIRHHLSARMAGEHIFWHYNPGMSLQHIYHAPHVIRTSTGDGKTPEETMRGRLKDLLESPDPAVRADAEKVIESFRERAKYYPIYEEPCFHVWIKDNLNLFCFAEEIMCRRSPNHDQGGGGILLLQDIERLVDVGLCFNVDEYYMVTAFGVGNEDGDPEFDNYPSPYEEEWKILTSMPSIHWEIPEE